MKALPSGLSWLRPLSAEFPHSCNSFAVKESDGTWTWIDPGAAGDDNLARTRAELEQLGLSLSGLGRVIITHAHVDHLGAAAALAGEGAPVPVLCHPDAVALATSLEALDRSFDLDIAARRFAADSARVARYNERTRERVFHRGAPFVAIAADRLQPVLVDGATVATGPLTWNIVDTPGHCPGHVALHEPVRGVLIAGDIVGHALAWHSPSGGGPDAFLTSLRRIARLDLSLILPAHGDAITDPAAVVSKLERRLIGWDERIVAAVAAGPRHYPTVYDAAVKDPERKRLFPFVPMLEGHLQRLEAAGAIREVEPGMLERA